MILYLDPITILVDFVEINLYMYVYAGCSDELFGCLLELTRGASGAQSSPKLDSE